MIFGLITVIVLLVIRLQAIPASAPVLPDEVALPEGVTAEAITFGRGWYAVVTGDDRILVYDAENHTLMSETKVTLTE